MNSPLVAKTKVKPGESPPSYMKPSIHTLDPRPPVGTIYETCWDDLRWKILEWRPDGYHNYVGVYPDGSHKPTTVGTSMYRGFPSNFTIVVTTDDPNGR